MSAMTAKQLYEQQIKLLPATERLRLVAMIAHDLVTATASEAPPQRSLLELEGLGADTWQDDETVQRERVARAEAILALCDAAAERFGGESDAAEDIRQMRDERIEQICRSGA